MVDIINQPPDHVTSSFDSIVRSYDHAAPHTCAKTTNSLTTTHISDKYNNTTISSVLDKSTESTRENKFHGHSTIATKSLFGITHILTGGISQAHIKRLAAAYTRLKETKRNKHSIISIQTLLHTLVISVSSYNPLCTQIPFDKCLKFDRTMHFKYIKDTNPTVTQPAHATFVSHDHHDLHIPSMFLTQL